VFKLIVRASSRWVGDRVGLGVFIGRSDEIEGNQVGKAISKSRCVFW